MTIYTMSIENNPQDQTDLLPISCIQFNLDDPTDIITDYFYRTRDPKRKAVLTVTLSREFEEIINDHSRPRSELLDEAIVEMGVGSEGNTLLEKFYDEVDTGLYTEYNCANCGAGLGLSGCDCCGHEFTDNGYRSSWGTPLSPKMTEFLKDNGFNFSVDPNLARQKEREFYQRYYSQHS